MKEIEEKIDECIGTHFSGLLQVVRELHLRLDEVENTLKQNNSANIPQEIRQRIEQELSQIKDYKFDKNPQPFLATTKTATFGVREGSVDPTFMNSTPNLTPRPGQDPEKTLVPLSTFPHLDDSPFPAINSPPQMSSPSKNNNIDDNERIKEPFHDLLNFKREEIKEEESDDIGAPQGVSGLGLDDFIDLTPFVAPSMDGSVSRSNSAVLVDEGMEEEIRREGGE